MLRNKLKLSKLTNKELIESALKAIEELGYTIKDKYYSNCYFLFEGEDDSICMFHIKEMPRVYICFLECK